MPKPWEGRPSEVVASHGLAVVSDDGAVLTAIDAAVAEQPDVLEMLRGEAIASAITASRSRRWVAPRMQPAFGTSYWSGQSYLRCCLDTWRDLRVVCVACWCE
jgi:hypothetical protein